MRLTNREIREYQNKIRKAVPLYNDCIIGNQGFFSIHNVPQSDATRIVNGLKKLDFIAEVSKHEGKLDFSHFKFDKGYAEPGHLYEISGKLKEKTESIEESIEAHETLNEKLWNEDKSLKQEVREKLLEIKDKYIENLTSNELKIVVRDVLLLGSNCNYNYTDNSDIDLHIIVDADIYSDADLAEKCYLAYCSIFNSKYDPTIYDIPVEIYVESLTTENKSNGVYSVLNNQWLKEPRKEDINFEAIDWRPEFEKQRDIAQHVMSDDNATSKDVDAVIRVIYNLRKSSMTAEGEYSAGNFAFKEIRNIGLLDALKTRKAELESKEMSLQEDLTNKKSKYLIRNLTEEINKIIAE